MSGLRVMTVNGVATHLVDQGPRDGPALVFSNSLGTDLRMWDGLLGLLPPGLRCLRYDTRGHGLTATPPGPWGMAALAADLAALIDGCGVRGAVIVGLSVGGMIGQALAAARPDLARGLVLMDTAARIGTAEAWDARIAAVRAHGVAGIADGVLARWFSAAYRASDPGLALWRAMLARTPADGYASLCATIRDTDLTDATRALRLPTLALAGTEDGATPPDLVAATAALIPGARFVPIAGAGHLPCVERPVETAAAITTFLREIGHV